VLYSKRFIIIGSAYLLKNLSLASIILLIGIYGTQSQYIALLLLQLKSCNIFQNFLKCIVITIFQDIINFNSEIRYEIKFTIRNSVLYRQQSIVYGI
jgi:hypothetical protein